MTSVPALPVDLDDGFAFYHPASGDTGYVFCGSWGYDEMCSRKFLRLVAQDIRDDGAPVLRFDYPGTVNMPDDADKITLAGWIDTATAAAERLKTLSGCSKIVFTGLGIGAAIAFLAAKERTDVVGLILAAPVTSGRRYMRELQLQAQVSDESLRLDLNLPKNETGFTGYTMPEGLQTSLNTIKLSPDGFRTQPRCLVVHREGNDTELAFADTLSEADWPVERSPFTGYFQLLATPTTSVLPREVMIAIGDYAKTQFGGRVSEKTVSPPTGQPPILTGETYREQPVLFNHDNRLFGVLCEPVGERHGPAVIFLNTGYCHHIGWGRIYVRAARHLATHGIASLRFDMANVGESPEVAGRAEQVLYTDNQFDDANQAIAFVKQRLPGPSCLVGRCSGAYVAFHTAALNPMVDGVMMINQLKLIWDPEDDVYEAVNFGARPLEEYGKRALSLTTFKRILRGEVNLKKAGGHILNHGRDLLARTVAPYLGNFTKLGRFRKICHARFGALAARNIPVTLVNCETDGSLAELAKYFGADLRGLSAFPNVNRVVVPNADHNLTPEAAQQYLLRQLLEMAESPSLAASKTRDHNA